MKRACVFCAERHALKWVTARHAMRMAKAAFHSGLAAGFASGLVVATAACLFVIFL